MVLLARLLPCRKRERDVRAAKAGACAGKASGSQRPDIHRPQHLQKVHMLLFTNFSRTYVNKDSSEDNIQEMG